MEPMKHQDLKINSSKGQKVIELKKKTNKNRKIITKQRFKTSIHILGFKSLLAIQYISHNTSRIDMISYNS